MVTPTLGMPTTLSMVLATIDQPSQLTPSLNIDSNLLTINEVVDRSQLMVMTTSFICQQIDMRISDLMYQMLKQLTEIVKPMV